MSSRYQTSFVLMKPRCGEQLCLYINDQDWSTRLCEADQLAGCIITQQN